MALAQRISTRYIAGMAKKGVLRTERYLLSLSKEERDLCDRAAARARVSLAVWMRGVLVTKAERELRKEERK